MSSLSIRSILSGRNAFCRKNYLISTKKDFASREALPAVYRWNSGENQTQTYSHTLYLKVHAFAARMGILPAAQRGIEVATNKRSEIPLNTLWKYKRIGIEVDGYHIDALLMGKATTLGNGRWGIISNGNNELYESGSACNLAFKQILTATRANAIVFNYPGVGASSGTPNKEALVKAYRAVLSFLEDQEHGIGAKKIFGLGFSIGGGVQGEALKNHPLKKGIRYVFIKDRTFSEMAKVPEAWATSWKTRFLSFLIRLIGWNLDSVASSKKLEASEIILQTANVKRYTELTNSSSLIHDGVIPTEASLAQALLDDPECPRKDKVFIGIPEDHNSVLAEPKFVARLLNKHLG